MPAALDTVSGQVTNPGGVITNLIAAVGDSFTLRNSNPAKRALLLAVWARNTTAGILQISSPNLHDATRAMRFRAHAAVAFPLVSQPSFQPLVPQDTLTVALSGGGGAEIDQASLLIYYEDMPGIEGRFIDKSTFAKRAKDIFAVETATAPGVTGNYSGSAAINASFDTFINNRDYALLGYHVDVLCTSVCWRGADTGNLRVSGPGEPTLQWYTKDWFMTLSDAYGLPLIPVFNSGNKAGITVDVVQNNGGAAVNVTSIFALLA